MLHCQKSNSSFVMLLVMIVEMTAMFITLMMMMQFGEEGKRGQSHLEPSKNELIIMLNWMVGRVENCKNSQNIIA